MGKSSHLAKAKALQEREFPFLFPFFLSPIRTFSFSCHMMFGAEASKNMQIFSIEVVDLICILTAMVQRRKVADGQRIFPTLPRS